MNRFTADEIKESWMVSPRIAKNQATKAIPLIEKEISELKCELEVCRDILERELPEKPKKPAMGDPEKTQQYARGDEDESGGVGSQVDDAVRAEA